MLPLLFVSFPAVSYNWCCFLLSSLQLFATAPCSEASESKRLLHMVPHGDYLPAYSLLLQLQYCKQVRLVLEQERKHKSYVV